MSLAKKHDDETAELQAMHSKMREEIDALYGSQLVALEGMHQEERITIKKRHRSEKRRLLERLKAVGRDHFPRRKSDATKRSQLPDVPKPNAIERAERRAIRRANQLLSKMEELINA